MSLAIPRAVRPMPSADRHVPEHWRLRAIEGIHQQISGASLGADRRACWRPMPSAGSFRLVLCGIARHATVDVLQANDVVLAEIRATLNFDEFERNVTRVNEAVRGSGRNVGRFILSQN